MREDMEIRLYYVTCPGCGKFLCKCSNSYMEHKCERCGAEYNIQIQDGLLMMRPKDKNDKKAGCKVMKKMNDNKPAVQAV